MVIPIVEVPQTLVQGLENYRELFCRDEGFAHVSRYVSGLVLSPNKTLQGIYDGQVWAGTKPGRRAMHEAVFEAGWDAAGLMKKHREVVAADHQGRGREVISLDWTLAHHERGPEIFAVLDGWDYVAGRQALYQTVMTAVISNRELIDGIEVVVHEPSVTAAEQAYLEATVKESYEQMEAVQQRLLELVHHVVHKKRYQKKTELAVEMVRQIEEERAFPEAHYAFDNGVLSRPLTQLIESYGKHWVSELERSRHIVWQGQWRRVDEVAQELRQNHPESFPPLQVRCRNGEVKQYWAFTKVVRLRKYGRKRLVIVHETEDLTDAPQFLLTDALHWESRRVIDTWRYRWASEIFHEFGKQVTGLESAQVRKEEAVNRHFRLNCLSQSLIQRAPATASKSERFEFAEGKITYGQKCRAITREAFHALLEVIRRLFTQGQSCDQVLEVLMPA